MTDDHDLRSLFHSVRAQPAPPHGLTGPAMLRAGHRARRRRRAAVAAGSVAAAAALAASLAIGLHGGLATPRPMLPGGGVEQSSTPSTPTPSDTTAPQSTPSPQASSSSDPSATPT